MKRKVILTFLILSFFSTQFFSLACDNIILTRFGINGSWDISDESCNADQSLIDYVEQRKQLWTHQETEIVDGFTLFSCNWAWSSGPQTTLIVDMNGNIVASEDDYDYDPELINSTTIFMNNESHGIFWNLRTNNHEVIELPQLQIFNKHHDIEYNPLTDQFLILGREYVDEVEISGTNFSIMHDSIILTDRNNDTSWYWSGAENIPFDKEYYYLTNHTWGGNIADWTHGNTIFWDMEEKNICYFNSRHLHTIYKINMTNGEIIWSLGEYRSNFTLYNLAGEEVSSLFYGAHSLEKIGDNKFIIYDNDEYNTTNFLSNWPRYVEFEIDEENWEAREIFTWTIPDNNVYIGKHWGDADHLPLNNILGTASTGSGGGDEWVILTEVNKDGEIVWEFAINGTFTYRAERFYNAPVVSINETSLTSVKGMNSIINITVWNSFRERKSSSGRVVVLSGESVLTEQNFEFLPYWQDTYLSIEIPTEKYKSGKHELVFAVENSDGISRIISLNLSVKRADSVGMLIGFMTLIMVTIVIRIRRRK
jgi:hypothetical protein